ncbi:GNAT family N-acetyltransferase [uncultured Brevibacillus sp.]|uniref:GNAT family N-acetyltransferase n=1 Tax=uncultured Brevibacillus sp. TaxID=169970 RepID=UPI0025973A92|nr:GNAT family N-acetyltransferase [uncultured Brevibacillus sp.]
MDIRRFDELDIVQIVNLFYDTVHTVNKQDYSDIHLDAWAPRSEMSASLNNWKESLSGNIAFVAELNSQIVGFSDMTFHGYLDRLFVHKDFQGQGIASALVNTLESEARNLNIVQIETNASITAKPFFEKMGYEVIQSQVVERNGVQLKNFKMLKNLTK